MAAGESLESMDLGKILVTGGAGFIGSHLVEKLIANKQDVKILDNLTSGKLENLFNDDCFNESSFIKKDLKDLQSIYEDFTDVKTVIHMAAEPEVRINTIKPDVSFRENIQNTFHVLEACRKTNVKNILFASSSVVYGEPNVIPTPEGYGPLFPISNYGATKMACESMISAYCHSYGINGLIFRFANIVGSRSNHGVIFDFVNKLRKNNKKLEILGDGTQNKSYLEISDCIEAILLCLIKTKKRLEVFNVGNDDKTDVISIAKTVCKNMNVEPEIITNGGVDNGRGWIGDIKLMQLDITKLKQLGWLPSFSSLEAVNKACHDILHSTMVEKIGSQ